MLAEIDYNDFIEFHLEAHSVATMSLTSRADNPADFGVARLHGTRIVKFSEKPGRSSVSHLVNSGIYIFDPKSWIWIFFIKFLIKHLIYMLCHEVDFMFWCKFLL